MFYPLTVLAGIILYVGLLLLIARWAEHRQAGDVSITDNALVYSLSLAVYCTSWTFYGSVGKAATSGTFFLTTYLGPTMAISLWWLVLRKMVRIRNSHRITSIADFISARYAKSQMIAALVTLMALVGNMPYIALQFKAIISTFCILTGKGDSNGSWIGSHAGPVVVCLMIAFTIVVGARRQDPTERHRGMIAALAVECMVKLVAFLAAGIFVTFFMYEGFGDIFDRLARQHGSWSAGVENLQVSSYSTWLSNILLSMSAIMFLPRQFHVAVVENSNERHILTAMWILPLYMFLISVFVYPIAMGGLLHGYPAADADSFVLTLPLEHAGPWLSFLVFIGGFSSAAGMIMISSMTTATMITNHLLLPAMDCLKWEWLGILRRNLLRCKWAAVACGIGAGYWFELQVGESFMLANIGNIAFAAALQFAPVSLGGIFWRKGNQVGAMMGLSAGFAVWCYTQLVPAFARSGWMSRTLLERGPWGIELLHPEHLFGITALDPVSHTVLWTVILNGGLYVLGSLCAEASQSERSMAAEFMGVRSSVAGAPPGHSEAYVDAESKREQIIALLLQYFTHPEARALADRSFAAAGLAGKDRLTIIELAELHSHVEKNLAGSIGAGAAHRALNKQAIFSEREARELSDIYGEILAELRVTPDELRKKVDYYQERASLLSNYARDLEEEVRKRAVELETAQEELVKREKLSVLGRLTATVSHELRNPLGVIRTSAFYLHRKLGASDEKISKHLRRIEEQVSTCDCIVGDLLEYTRGRQSERVPGEISPWIEKTLSEIGFPEHVELIRELAGGLPRVSFDKEKMRRVLINVTDNALQAVAARRERNAPEEKPYVPRVQVRTTLFDGRVRIEVEDNGVGMDEETVARAFEPLYTTRARGTGLGLAIVRKIIEEHGGTVALASKCNDYTKVIITVPCDEGASIS